MSPDPDGCLERLRAIALALPRTVEKISHGMPVFFIEKGKTFAWFLHDHHGSGITAVAVKTSGAEEQEMLVEADPDLYYRPPYLAPSGWIGVRLDGEAVDWDHVADRIATSWELVAPAKLLEMGGR
ncbi:MmcQ/YjbR family DNA-binding protein [Sphingosinicella sp. LHD-64]|uniref:MmcQ/YjbR family DNA-binding protein n=1 Tax=Sphingosinicella sp. LHD-64 TaxID=3072139 RepID=UPI00280D2F5D|nr:MmcQ/YjbR family DNA-binding protein [Sphingosinicella sp. LHD-64]MDQ8754994.1 MmcQ/YjbR family DNA-binding protein [Sphingosinicella sp. LHD-64]